jgi:hypothetical protein
MLTRNGTTIRNIARTDPGPRQPGRVAVTISRLEGSSRVALSIGGDATSLVRSYDIPIGQFLQLVASVVTADDLARAGIALKAPAAAPRPCPGDPGDPGDPGIVGQVGDLRGSVA